MGTFLRYSGPNREHIDQEPALFAAKQFVHLVDNHAPKLQSLVTKVIDDELYSLSNLRYLGYLTQVLSQFTRSDSYLSLDHFQDLACCCQPNQFYMEKITQGLSAAFSHEGCDAMVTRIEGGLDHLWRSMPRASSLYFYSVLGHKDFGALVKAVGSNDVHEQDFIQRYSFKGEVLFSIGLENLPIIIESNNLLSSYAYEGIAVDVRIFDFDGREYTFGLKESAKHGLSDNGQRIRPLQLLAGLFPEGVSQFSYTKVATHAERVASIPDQVVTRFRNYMPQFLEHNPPFTKLV